MSRHYHKCISDSEKKKKEKDEDNKSQMSIQYWLMFHKGRVTGALTV